MVMGAYYIASGVWPIVHMQSFEAVTGPKTDRWLVKTVAALALANGVALTFGARRNPIARETVVLALATAAAFSIVDVVFVLRGRVRPIYLGDTALELALVTAIVAGG